MVNKSYAIATGAFVLLLAVALIAMGIWLSNYQGARLPYILVSRHSVTGLGPGATVEYRGVPVGSVASITIDPHPPHDILVHIAIAPNTPVTHGTYAILQSQGVTGVRNVELGDSGNSHAPLPTSTSAPAHIPLRRSELDTLLGTGKTLLARLSQLAVDLDRFASPDNRMKVATILANTSAATQQLVADGKKLRVVLSTLPRVSQQTQHTLRKIDVLTAHLDTLSESLDRVARGTNAATQLVRATTLPRFNALLTQLQETSKSLKGLATVIRKDPQRLLYGYSPPPGPGEPGYHR